VCPDSQDTAHPLAVPSSPLFEVLGDEFIKAWHKRHSSAQPQFWIWIVWSLDRMNAGMASAAGNMYTVDAIESRDMCLLMEMVYERPFERFCDYVLEIKCMSRSERHMDIIPSIAPEYLKPKANKRQKIEEGSKTESGPNKGNDNGRKSSGQPPQQQQQQFNAPPQSNG